MGKAIMASMAEAEKIFDVAARHSYVFDNGLSSPDFFDVEKRVASEEFSLIRDRVGKQEKVLEIGCFTGLNLLGLASLGYDRLYGFDFVKGAIDWLQSQPGCKSIIAWDGTFNKTYVELESSDIDAVICFDVLEHQLNVGEFLSGVQKILSKDGKALFLVPKGENYNDCGHVAWFPNEICFRNVLGYYFDVAECFELKSCPKLFACCKRKS